MTVTTVTTACAVLHSHHHDRFEWQQGYGYDGYAHAYCPDYAVAWRVYRVSANCVQPAENWGSADTWPVALLRWVDRMLHEACLPACLFLTVLFVRCASAKSVCCSC